MPETTGLIAGKFKKGQPVRYMGRNERARGRYGLIRTVIYDGPSGTSVALDNLLKGEPVFSTSVTNLEPATLEDYEMQRCLDRIS